MEFAVAATRFTIDMIRYRMSSFDVDLTAFQHRAKLRFSNVTIEYGVDEIQAVERNLTDDINMQEIIAYGGRWCDPRVVAIL